MADYIKVSRGRSFLSNIAYVLLNIFLAIVTTVLVIVTDSWVAPCLLIILSKWRVFAVRPRYWLANVKSNIVDITIGISFVAFIYAVGNDATTTRFVLTALYAIWLLFIKPRSDQKFIDLQAGLALFMGTAMTAMLFFEPIQFNLFGLTLFEPDALFLVVLNFIIGYSAARHVLIAGDENHVGLLSLTHGLIVAEISWVSYHWLISYNIVRTELAVPQLAIITTLVSFATLSIYQSYVNRDGQIKRSDIMLPIVFSAALILIILLIFSEPIWVA